MAKGRCVDADANGKEETRIARGAGEEMHLTKEGFV